MRIYTIIATYNGSKWIRGALESLKASTVTTKLIIVDNASSDDTTKIVKMDFPEAKIICKNVNVGFGRANNIGIREALLDGADFIFLLNQDAYVLPDTLERLTLFLSCHPNIEACSPIHCSPNDGMLDSKTQLAYLQRYASNYISDACVGTIKPYYLVHGMNAAAWMLKPTALHKVGGFDPLFFMYGEDDDLLNRFSYHKVQFALVTNCKVVHLREKSSKSLGFLRSMLVGDNRIRSGLLIDFKNPRLGFRFKLLQLICNGLLRPTIDFLIDRDGRRLIQYYIGTFGIVYKLFIIQRHVVLCRQSGDHFLCVKETQKNIKLNMANYEEK